LIEWLDARFGHADYLQLNQKYKLVHFENVALEMLEMIASEVKGEKKELTNEDIVSYG